MKKLLALTICIIMLFALAIPATAQNVVLPTAPKADIKIDGEKDDGYGDPFTLNSYRGGNGDGATATMWSAWNDKGIYYYMEVKDVTPNHDHNNSYERDNIEFFIDWQSAVTGASADSVSEGDNCWQVRVASAPNEDGNHSSGTLGDDTLELGVHFVVKPLVGGDLKGGYKMEVWLPFSLTDGLSAANVLAVGKKLFVDFQIADNQEDGGRSSQVFIDGMADGTDSQWNTPDAFQGVLVLGEAKAAPPPATPDPVVPDAPVAGGDEVVAPPPVVVTPPKAPKVGDMGAIMLVITMAASGVTLFRRKK